MLPAEAISHQIVNLNPNSALKCFPFGDVDKVLAETKSADPTITVITPTGDRPLAFALCRRWMANQTRRPGQWLVIDDGKIPMTPAPDFQYVRREPQADDPAHTLITNLKTAVPFIKGDKILIMEDDEYYAPTYIEEMVRRLDQHEVAGIGHSKYYHLPTGGYAVHANTVHASLAETGFRASFLPKFVECLTHPASNDYLDIRLWRIAAKDGLFVDSSAPLYLGVKGLPGRKGIGAGHVPAMYHMTDDAARSMLEKLAPRGYRVYMDIISGKLTDANVDSYFHPTQPITGITVCWNTKDLMERAYNSIRKFHPDMPIIIIDGSDADDPCAAYVRGLVSAKTMVIQPGRNIGHGRGMCLGIEHAETPYALIFDSDIEMLKSPVEAMLAMMESDTFGVGYIEKTGFDGFEYGANPWHINQGWMPMLHPYFHLINIANYKKFHPYVHHGAPCYLTALDIYKRGLSGKIVKEFPGLGHSSGRGHVWTGQPREYIRHDPAGTRAARRKTGLGEIEGDWVRNTGQV
jgi:hypothetical protein